MSEYNYADDDQIFQDFLEQIQALAEEYSLPVSYIEEEFVIDGELIQG